MTTANVYGASHTEKVFGSFLEALASTPDYPVSIFELVAQPPSDLAPTPGSILDFLADAVGEEWGLDFDPTQGVQEDEELVRLANELASAFRAFVDRSGAVRGTETLRSWTATRTADGFQVAEQ